MRGPSGGMRTPDGRRSPLDTISRRGMLQRSLGAWVTTALARGRAGAEESSPDVVALARQRLRSVMPSREEVDDFLTPQPDATEVRASRGWTYDAELGWSLVDAVRPDGINGSRTYYRYEEDGARRVINAAGQPCRVHTYGNSFTHCDQVSDGETWQEYLAAHLQEPIRNYGVGGYSVYQAYRRMLRVEKSGGAKYILLNVYDRDHQRNLSPWWAISSVRTPHDFTLPHLRVNVEQSRCDEIENPLGKAADLYKLCDEDFVWRTFKDEPVLQTVLAAEGDEALARQLVGPIAAGFGVPRDRFTEGSAVQRIARIHMAAALYATRNVITWTERFVAKTGKKLLLLLTFGRGSVLADLQGQPRFDQELLDWLKDKPYPVLDVRDAFRAEYEQFRGDVKRFLDRYYNGHHSPAGNYFLASAIRDRLIKALEPAPLPYR
jgi:hypothetical protein